MSFVFEVNVEPQPPNGRRRRFYDASRGLATRHGTVVAHLPSRRCRAQPSVKHRQIAAIYHDA
ncbi:hypothetical protein [Burkholderia cenocepacia]|uniref:hypothetical protein n=1 Tax=Burkholderia cenocepacia TaxID=95486 RepID=UPI002AB71D53|nr:hypothetical protein [Burkholderia cenocepacia]